MKYLIGALVLLAILFLIWWFVSRGKQRQLEEQRAEAAALRAGVEERTAALRGQETFAQQADERAMVARQEAEERARQAEASALEAQRVEDEARRHQADLEHGRMQRDAELRRADEIDPDVEVADDDPRPLPEDLDDDVRPLDDTRVHEPVPSADAPARTGWEPPGEPTPEARTEEPAAGRWDQTTTEKRPSLFTEEPADTPAHDVEQAPAPDETRDQRGWGTGAAAAGAGAAAVGSAYAATRGNEPAADDDAARLASGVDYGDEVPEAEDSVTESTAGDEHAAVDEPAVDEPVADEFAADEPPAADEPVTDEPVADESAAADADAGVGEGEIAMVEDVEDYASTEPLLAEEQQPGVAPDASADADAQPGYEGSRDDLGDEDVPATDDTWESTSEEPTTEETWEQPTDVDNPQVAEESSVEDTGTTETTVDDTATDESVTDEPMSDESVTGESVSDEPMRDEADETDGTDGTDGTDEDRADESSSWGGATGAVAGAAAGGAAGAAAGAAADSDSEDDADAAGQATGSDSDSGEDVDADGGADAGADAAAESDSGATDDQGDATHWPDGTDRINPVDDESASDDSGMESAPEESDEGMSDDSASDDSGMAAAPEAGDARGDEYASTDADADADTDDTAGQDTGDDTGGSDEGGWSRRISSVEEIQDGGYGVGSAATFEDRAQPLDHPVQAYRDTMTFRVPGADGYDSAEPDVWFYDEEAARRAGFTPSEG